MSDTDLDIDHLLPGPWHELTVTAEQVDLAHPDDCPHPRCQIGRNPDFFAVGLPVGVYRARVSGLGAEYQHADGSPVDGRPARLDPIPMTKAAAERYADLADEALNAYWHQDQCNCDTWPTSCHSGYTPGQWDTSAWYAALPVLIAAVRADLRAESRDHA
ncbi:hypothetical protein QMK19_03435 [Streptomyces sp. H10-C2]|uniref:hypothetical protein n=1 Tax=unclassified Streptomyces TaxID=2593676 RepID=UPI0024BA6C92|nr:MULTISPECIES: hypothetical protein [unclassified Streptomyces]MDJ0342239.1 hypothetical protein [Streptomyces sp. PH10-H1]MDJ0368753.1 hypothetical protein [Streptomyces sp. H10-C2]